MRMTAQGSDHGSNRISFEPFKEEDISLLISWFKASHVRRFWSESEDEIEVRKKYSKKLNDQGVLPRIILLEGRAIGYIQAYQACLVGDGWWPGVEAGVFGIDQFIGEVELIGKGLGAQIINQFVKSLILDPRVQEIIADPDPTNLRAIKAYEKAGFIASGVISTPDGEAVLMRFNFRRTSH